MVVAFALANKMARGIWAMLTRGEDYRGWATASAAGSGSAGVSRTEKL